MNKALHFTYESIGNITKLFTSIRFEKLKSQREVAVFHQRFDNEDDSFFEEILKKLFPEGKTITPEDIDLVVEYISSFMDRDERCKELYAEYDKFYYKSYVYFKIDKKVYPAEFGNHMKIVELILMDYFKGFNDVSAEYLKKFVRENFEISSDNTTLERAANDAGYLQGIIAFNNAKERKNKNE